MSQSFVELRQTITLHDYMLDEGTKSQLTFDRMLV